MTLLLWLPMAGTLLLSLLLAAAASVARDRPGGAVPGSTARGWSLGPDGLRLAGWLVLTLGGLAALWVGVGDRPLRSVLSGRAPFDVAAAGAVGAAALVVGGVLLATRGFRRSPM